MFQFQTLFLFTLLSAVFLPGASLHAATPDACAAAPEFSLPDERLVHLAQAVRGQDAIDVLAVGSGTMVGQDGGSGNAFPYRLIQGLRSELPGREIGLTLRGSRGATAEEMLKLIEAELVEQHFALVLWQTGTVEALRDVPPAELRKVLEAGVAKVRANGADLVLIDAQFSKTMAAKVNEQPYLEVLRQVAQEQGVVLFRRYDLMQSWVADGRNDLEHVRKADREKVIDALHVCLAQVLVKFVSQGAGIKTP